MASLTIYLDEETLRAVERAAGRENCSISSWARRYLAAASHEKEDWPDGYFEAIAAYDGTEIEEPPEVAVALDAISLDQPDS